MIHLRLLQLARDAARPLTVVVALGIALSALAVGQALVLARIFTDVVAGTSAAELAGPLALLVAALLVRPVLALSRELAVHRVATSTKVHIRREIVDAEAAAGSLVGPDRRSGQRQSLLVDGVENLEPYFGRYVPQVVVTLVTALGVVAALVVVDPVVGTVVGVVAVLVPFVPRLWDRALAHRGETHWNAYASLNADVVDSLRGMTTLKALGAAGRRRAELARAGDSLLAATLGQLRLSLAESGLTGLFLVAGPATALVVALLRIDGGHLAPSALFTVTLLSFEVFRPFRDLSNHWHAGYAGVAAGTQILRVITGAPEQGPPPGDPAGTPGPVGENHPPSLGSLSVEARCLTFRYPGASDDALDGVDLVIPAGTTAAIVGPSGSGKSTLATLLLRLGIPTAGELRIGGTPTASLSQEDCSRVVSLVSQDPVLFAGSIRHNLALVAPEATEADLLEALDAAGATDLLDPHRGGLDALVGDNGGLLSGGQRQRLAIARALLRDPAVLVLDEASSALDARRERDVFERLSHARRRDGSPMTTVFIAHRLPAIRGADVVVVLDQGRVVETGSYDDLLERDGLLARLHAAQHDEVLA